MDTKPFYQSKTFWVNIFAALGLVVNTQMQGFDLSPESQAVIIAFINVVLRFVSKDTITLN